MKKLYLILMATVAMIMAPDFNGAYADGGRGIALSQLEGSWVTTPSPVSITLCFKPDFSANEACSAADAVGVPFTDPAVGNFIQDTSGNFCGTITDVLSVPGDVHTPTVTVQQLVGKFASYDPTTGSGDVSYTLYSGGKCKGAIFSNTGATANSSAMAHAVASDHGERVDYVITTVTDPTGVTGAFALFGTNLKQ